MDLSTPAVEISRLVKRYGAIAAVDHLDLAVPSREILALLGPNGAGKSTVAEMMLGLTTPDSGTVSVFGQTARDAVRQGLIGGMLQNGVLLPDSTVLRVLRTMHGLHARPLALDEVIERADLHDILKSSTNRLSGGQAQRVRFALAIMADPRLLLLDEPTVGMDPDARRRFWATMDHFIADGRTVVFATHYLDEADAYAGRIVVMDEGRIVADGTGAAIKSQVGGRQVSFKGDDRDYSALPGVVSTESHGRQHHLRCSDSDAALRALVGYGDVTDIEVTAPRLEDAFLDLVA